MTDQQQWQNPWPTQTTPDSQAQAAPEGSLFERIKAKYAEVDQPGLDPGNRPAGTVEGERDLHKTTWDLEDITGNPGHRNCNPNAPAEIMHPVPELPPMQEQQPG